MADLASHVEKETPFDKLPRDERITALVVVAHYESGARDIEAEIKRRAEAATAAPTAEIPAEDSAAIEAEAATAATTPAPTPEETAEGEPPGTSA